MSPTINPQLPLTHDGSPWDYLARTKPYQQRQHGFEVMYGLEAHTVDDKFGL